MPRNALFAVLLVVGSVVLTMLVQPSLAYTPADGMEERYADPVRPR